MIRHFDIQARFEGDTVILEQRDCGELSVIHLADEQLLMLADKLRGIDRPSPEDQESRKLRVLHAQVWEIVGDEDFRRSLLDGQCHTDWLERIDALHTVAREFAHGLQPYNFCDPSDEREQQNKPQNDLSDSDTAQHQPAQKNASAIPETMPLPIL